MVNLTNLEKMNIDFMNSDILTDKTLLLLSVILKISEKIKYLYLEINCSTKITDKGLIEIADGIKELKNLKNIKLRFYKNQNFTDDSIIAFSIALLKNQI